MVIVVKQHAGSVSTNQTHQHFIVLILIQFLLKNSQYLRAFIPLYANMLLTNVFILFIYYLFYFLIDRNYKLSYENTIILNHPNIKIHCYSTRDR